MPKIKSEIRKDYLLDKYVIVTPGRATRPRDIKGKTVKIANKKCPFCPKNIAIDNVVDTIPNQKNWQVLSLKNIFPAVSLENNKAYGKQEVIIDTPDHAKDLAAMTSRALEIISLDLAINTPSKGQTKTAFDILDRTGFHKAADRPAETNINILNIAPSPGDDPAAHIAAMETFKKQTLQEADAFADNKMLEEIKNES